MQTCENRVFFLPRDGKPYGNCRRNPPVAAIKQTNRTELETQQAKAVLVNGSVQSIILHGVIARDKRDDNDVSATRYHLSFTTLVALDEALADWSAMRAELARQLGRK